MFKEKEAKMITLKHLKELAEKISKEDFHSFTYDRSGSASRKLRRNMALYQAALSPEVVLALVNAVEALKLITEYGDIHGAPSRHATKTLAALDAALEFSNGA
jgi:hypothetical protein